MMQEYIYKMIEVWKDYLECAVWQPDDSLHKVSATLHTKI